ncbi:MAG: hypothetical protein WB555_06850, partial [Candidatus Korobacteraceae bacterium]
MSWNYSSSALDEPITVFFPAGVYDGSTGCVRGLRRGLRIMRNRRAINLHMRPLRQIIAPVVVWLLLYT